ncbi:hypothetical protein M0R19_07960 [Candidatus Pacearchaeota archaeon]|jgi:hypothetical protein|nr:hypothetical protein [bacterium]MCK9597092.1 hypothetical protein [Candidatus Pacearchaeota archaeon]
MGWFFKDKCKHDWETVSDKIITSTYPIEPEFSGSLFYQTISEEAYIKTHTKTIQTHIVILKCKNCGELKKFTT